MSEPMKPVSDPEGLPGYNAAFVAGFAAGHAITTIATGEPLMAFVMVERADWSRAMRRHVGETAAASADAARQDFLATISAGAVGDPSVVNTAFAFQAPVDAPDHQGDALFIQARRLDPSPVSMAFVFPFRAAADPDGFALLKYKFIELDGASDDCAMDISLSFLTGLDEHEEGAKIKARFEHLW